MHIGIFVSKITIINYTYSNRIISKLKNAVKIALIFLKTHQKTIYQNERCNDVRYNEEILYNYSK